MIDLHCHILPGVGHGDDGPRDLETALSMARIAVEDGLTTLVATPHLLLPDLPDPSYLREHATAFAAAVRAEGLALEILPGAEIAADWSLLDHLDTLPRLGTQDRYILLEVPLNTLPDYLERLVFELQVRGVRPVLGHPERTQLAAQAPEVLLRLAERGCPLQLNADSLTGRSGRAIRAVATRLLREVQHCVLASDAHDPDWRPPVLSPARRALRALGGEERFRQLTEEYPRKILAGEVLT
jgi:protein-tyrosine phosphatase